MQRNKTAGGNGYEHGRTIELRERIKDIAEHAHEVADEASTEGWTEERREKVRGLLAEAQLAKTEYQQLTAGGDDWRTTVRDMLGFTGDGSGLSSFGRGKRRDFGWTAEIVKRAFPFAAKELVAPGSAVTATPLLPGVTQEPQRATHITDLIPTRTQTGPTFAYLRQIPPRESNAAPVELGAEKPVTPIQLEQIVGAVATIAHISEAIPRQWISDSQAVATFVNNELLYGLLVALDAAVLHGYTNEAGTEEEGLLTSSGHVLQEFDTDVFRTMRQGILALEAQDLVATAAIMSPVDFAAAELAQNDAGQFVMTDPGRQLPLDSARRTIWGLPVMVTTALSAGTAIVLNAQEAAEIQARENSTVTWSENVGSDFTSNLLRFRAELRCGLAITRPAAVVEVQVTGS